MSDTTANTAAGKVQGVATPNGVVFRGVPYAASTAGERRHLPPQPVEPWTGVRDCSEFGPICPQISLSSMGGGPMGLEDEPMAEDCLYLNVFTPAADGGRRPTVVWVHGGGWALGSGSKYLYDGESFARDGVVLVSLNYRLHALGFLHLDGLFDGAAGTGNLGILDQIAALRWVRDNISEFGGDPDNVTFAGQSAGGMSGATLMATPAASGLFRRVVAQSGAGNYNLRPETARRVTERFLEVAGVAAGDWSALRAIPAARVVEIATQLQGECRDAGWFPLDQSLLGADKAMMMPFLPVVDGTTRAAMPIDAIQAGEAAGIDILLGTTTEETRTMFYGLPAEVRDAMPEPDFTPFIESSGRAVDEVLKIYAEDRPEANRWELLCDVIRDYMFTIPALRLAEAQAGHGAKVYLYRFSWRTPVFDGTWGACHILDVPFVFEVQDDPRAAGFVGDDPPADLAAAMHQAWVRFAMTGDPNGPGLPEWPAYDTDTRPVMDFGETREVVKDPDASLRCLWEGVR